MSESSEVPVAPSAKTVGRRVDFGVAGEGDGLAWGIEVDLDITDPLVRARLQDHGFKIPSHIKKIVFLDLAPQEALPPEQRNIRSKIQPRAISGSSMLNQVATSAKPGNPTFEKIRRGFNVMRPADETRYGSLRDAISWVLTTDQDKNRFEEVLSKSSGQTLVVVHGHSSDLSGMGEQYPDQTKDAAGKIVQREHNFVPMDDILDRYDKPSEIAAIVLNGCNTEKGSVEAKKVPVFYPTIAVKGTGNPGFVWSPASGASIPK